MKSLNEKSSSIFKGLLERLGDKEICLYKLQEKYTKRIDNILKRGRISSFFVSFECFEVAGGIK